MNPSVEAEIRNAIAFVALERCYSPEQEVAIRKKLAESRARHEERRRRQYEVIEEEIWG